MNYIKIFTVVYCILLFSCSLSGNEGYKITGKTSYTGKVYLNDTQGYKMIPVDSVEIVNGEFVFTGKTETCEQCFLTFENQKGAFGFFLSNEEIDLTISDKHPYFSKVTKSPMNMEYQVFTTEMNDLMEKQSAERRKYYNEQNKSKQDSLLKILQGYGIRQTDLVKSTFENNIEKTYAVAILAQYMKNSYTPMQLDSIIKKMPASSLNNKMAKQLISEIEATKRSSEGQVFINIEQKSPDGNLISLKDIVANNKCVMIDFWASWCSPCIASMPEFKKLYKEYKDKGFEIYAVSIDDKKENWLKAIKNHELSWIHVSDLKGWNTQAKTDYAVKGVPTTVLINRDGIIVAKNRHGEELEDKIIECLR